MFETMKKRGSRLIAAALAISSLALTGAAAADQSVQDPELIGYVPTAVLSADLSANVGTALTSDAVTTAEQALAKAKAEAEAKAKAEAEAKAAAAEAAARMNSLFTAPVTARTVNYSDSLLADGYVKENSRAVGNFRLSFYCSCAVCNGTTSGLTAIGTYLTEGRTIAVDPRIIPLGSRVFIDGYGVFIAEDTGGAIKGNRIDVLVGSHSRAYDIGIRYANVYILG